MPDKNQIQQSLYDFDATIKAKPNLTDKELLSKFPEFGNDINKLQAAKDYSVTLNSGKYKSVDEFNNKFPEFFSVEKKNSLPSPYSNTQLPSVSKEGNMPTGLPFLGNTLQEAVAKDKTPKTNWVAAKYNDLVGVVGNMLGGLASLQEKRYNAGLEKAMELSGETKESKDFLKEKLFIKGSGEEVKGKVEKLRSGLSDKEYEQKINEFDISDGLNMSDFGGMLNSAPSQLANMALAIPSYGSNYYLQSVDDAVTQIEKSPNANKVSEGEKLLYANTQGLVQAALEYLPIKSILNKTGLGNTVKNAITKTVLNNFVKNGVKATAKELEQAVTKEVSSFSKKAMRVGIDAVYGGLLETPTEVAQTIANDAIKLATNALKEKNIFDENDIKKNFWKNVGNSAAGAIAFGTPFGGGAGLMKNTNKAIRNEIAKAENQQDLEKIKNELNYQVELGNITPQEAESANITAQQYAEIASKIPNTVEPETKSLIIGGIEQRENVKKEIEKINSEAQGIDESFLPEKQANIDLLNSKLGQINDYLDGLVTGVKTEYVKEGDKHFKIDSKGDKIEIPKEYYDIAIAVDKENERKAKEAELPAEVPIEEPKAPIVEGAKEEVIEPIGQLGTGSNVYFETNKYRVNDLQNGNIVLNIGDKNGEVPLRNVEFDNKNEAVFVAKKLEENAPEGLVSDYHNIDKIIDNYKKEYKESLIKPTEPTKQPTVSETIPEEGVVNGVGELKIKNKTKDILDEVTDEKIGEKKYQDFSIDFKDGATAFGTIENGIAKITGIKAPKKEGSVFEPKRGTKTYERVIEQLKKNGIKTIKISLQSKDSQIVLSKLVEKGILTNPRDMQGISDSQFATTFDISTKEVKPTETEPTTELPTETRPETNIPTVESKTEEGVSTKAEPITETTKREPTEIEMAYEKAKADRGIRNANMKQFVTENKDSIIAQLKSENKIKQQCK